MNKTINQKLGILLFLCLFLLHLMQLFLLMTVVNYSFQETFGNNVFAWEGTRWFKQIFVIR